MGDSINRNDNIPTPILLVDVPGTLTIVKQQREQFSILQLRERVDLLANEMVEIIPVRRGGKDNDDRGGGYGGGRVDVEFGPGGPEWSASVYGGYEDERGNFAEVEVKRNENGRTSASAEGGHDKDK